MTYNQARTPSSSQCGGVLLNLLLALLAGALGLVLICYWTYGLDTNHDSRAGIWWPEGGRELIPPKAIDITLQRDLLDHRALYRISEQDLEAFLDAYFEVSSRRERSPIAPDQVGKVIGPLGWIATKDAVVYSHWTSNGAASTYLHDPVTGLTYQVSAYW